MIRSKINCWEFKQCGREPGGAKAAELGIRPAAMEKRTHGLNGGQRGGRACWAIAGTLCGNRVQGSFALKLDSCLRCDFYHIVKFQEGNDFLEAENIMEIIFSC